MRQNLIIVLLSVIATLLGVLVFTRQSPVILGQMAGGGTAAVGGEIGIATGSLGGGAGSALYIYIPGQKKLLAYYLGNTGLEVRAVRDVSFDLMATEFTPNNGKQNPRVNDMKKAALKGAKAAPATGKREPESEE